MVSGSNLKRTPRTKTRRPRLPASLLLLLSFSFTHAPDSFAQATRRPAPRLFGTTEVYEWGRLQSFARYLKRRPRERGHVLVYTPRVRTFSAPDAEAHIKSLKEELFESLGVEPGRVTFVDGGLREEEAVELWVVPRGASRPEPRPTAPREALTICPQVYAGGETFMLRMKQPLTFVLTLYDGDPSVHPSIRWTVSHGRILSGQGEQTIKVGELEEGAKVVTAAVEIEGLPAGCASRRTAETGIGIVPYKLDEYGNIRIGDEKARLDNFAIGLQNEPGLIAYVVAYGGRRGRRNEARNRADRAVNYLVNSRGILPEQVTAVDGGLREELTVELWVSTRGGPAPVPTPTVVPKAAPRNVRSLTKPRRGARR
jgi:hypothetical protein